MKRKTRYAKPARKYTHLRTRRMIFCEAPFSDYLKRAMHDLIKLEGDIRTA
jgi:hypothetical protein